MYATNNSCVVFLRSGHCISLDFLKRHIASLCSWMLIHCSWNSLGNTTGATDLFIQLMDSLYPINTNMLFMIQGPAQFNLTGVGGSGFQTNIPLYLQPDNKPSDPNPFFKQVLVKPYASKVSGFLLNRALDYLAWSPKFVHIVSNAFRLPKRICAC